MIGHEPSSLKEIIRHLDAVYCQSIGIEYMYIRKPEVIEWIEKKLSVNDNLPNFSIENKKHILTLFMILPVYTQLRQSASDDNHLTAGLLTTV